MYDRKTKIRVRKAGVVASRVFNLIMSLAGLLIGLTIASQLGKDYRIIIQSPIYIERQELVSPLPEVEEATESAKIIDTPRVAQVQANEGLRAITPTEQDLNTLEGEASYYSRAGCLGCSETLTMANGESLDDEALTLALTPELVRANKLLNKYVTVENIKTGQSVSAKVTDTGGFARHNRVADLTIGTKNAIGCESLCQVKITY